MNPMEIGNRLAELRNRKKMTRMQLADQLLVEDTVIRGWEEGIEYPPIETFPLIADIFDVSIDYLLLGKTEVQQRMLAGPPYSIYSYGRLHKYGIIDQVNEDYLSKGWHVLQSQITVTPDGEERLLVVIEK